METNSERRRRKLGVLCAAKGGYKAVAAEANLSAPNLWQILNGIALPMKKGDGLRSERGLGDPAARAIETAYKLGRGWFDNDEEEATMSPKELQLLGLYRELDNDLQEIVLTNVREVVEERARMLERMKIKPPPRHSPFSGTPPAGVSRPPTAKARGRSDPTR